MDKQVGSVFETIEYDKFNFLEENRAITKIRKDKVKKSIDRFGYIYNPIIVNEKFEIIDGQARFEVLKDLGLPIQYTVKKGLSASECIALNTTVTIWSLDDYIDSYMKQGREDYRRLWYLMTKYKTEGIGIKEILFACNYHVDSDNNKIKAGRFKLSEEEMETADDTLTKLKYFTPAVKAAQKGRIAYIHIAIMFAITIVGIDVQRLLDRVNRYFNSPETPIVMTVDNAFKSLNFVYNYHSSKKIHLEIDYEKFQAERYEWYIKRYGKNYIEQNETNAKE